MRIYSTNKLLVRFMLFGTPLWILLGLYLLFDPFCVITPERSIQNKPNVPVSDYLQVRKLLHEKDSGYNSFSLGNSRMISYVGAYPNYISSQARYADLHNAGESLYHIQKKIQLLDDEGFNIKNILIGLDEGILYWNKQAFVYSPALLHHPTISKTNTLVFHYTLFRLFLTNWFFIKYVDYKINQTYRPYMKDAFSDPANERDYMQAERIIVADSLRYYQQRQELFQRTNEMPRCSKRLFSEEEKKSLAIIKSIFDKHNTSYRIVINPNYERTIFNSANKNYLDSVFAASFVFDFSGNSIFTKDIGNWFEPSHFRPHVGKNILDQMYTTKSNIE